MVKTGSKRCNDRLTPGETAETPSADRGMATRRSVLSTVFLTFFGGGLAGQYLVGSARADAAVTGLSVDGDAITTDNGQLTGLTATVSGHLSYDGLDTEATTVDVELYAAPSGGATSAARNQIAASSYTVALESGLDTHAGHRDFGFSDADVLAADDLVASDFSATGDGTTKDTNVDFRLAMAVADLDGNVLVSAAATATATISVTNEANSANAHGSGSTTATGTNQSP